MIDVHIIKPRVFTPTTEKWFKQCLRSLENEPVNIYYSDYVQGDIREARYVGFSKGREELVSFVDYDDWVEPGAFKLCEDALIANTAACGAFTLSNVILVTKDGTEHGPILLNEFKEWPMKTRNMTDIHQLTVMRRDDVLSVFRKNFEIMPKIVHEMTWVYWEMSRCKPWIPIDFIGYNWRQHKAGAHHYRAYTTEVCYKRMLEIRNAHDK